MEGERAPTSRGTRDALTVAAFADVAELLELDRRTVTYLATLSRLGTLTGSCRVARVSPNTVYAWRIQWPAFAAAEQDARDAYADQLEEEAWRRSVRGTLKPVFQGGKRVGAVREYSDSLLQLLLRGARPAKFRERYELALGEPHDDGDDSFQPEVLDQVRTLLLAAPAGELPGDAGDL